MSLSLGFFTNLKIEVPHSQLLTVNRVRSEFPKQSKLKLFRSGFLQQASISVKKFLQIIINNNTKNYNYYVSCSSKSKNSKLRQISHKCAEQNINFILHATTSVLEEGM
ncbi:Hypothetical_protein [Hexamita inflata]|uniref:Hypothetical_protein n=1 Tax=Hexamita inflata TaxID=28002 RepID=A0AA86UB03_9EUKA|nr:Hypothetical protein HINF_LOCUS36059 [Hexamita inflata]